jgi:hypothetical protein
MDKTLVAFRQTVKEKRLVMKKYATKEKHVLYYFYNYKGPHRKAIAIHSATEVHLHLKMLISFNKNVFLNTTERFKQENFI